jgi:hypothetical protein
MATTDQINDFTAFAKTISQQEGEDIALDEIFSRFWQERHVLEDVAAIREAHKQYESGERGVEARTELADFRAQRAAKKRS